MALENIEAQMLRYQEERRGELIYDISRVMDVLARMQADLAVVERAIDDLNTERERDK